MRVFFDGNTIATVGLSIGWGGLLVAALIFRFINRSSRQGAEKRDTRSIIGIMLQGAGVAAAWAGPSRIPWTYNPAELPAGLAISALAIASMGLFIWAGATMGANWSLVARMRGDHTLVRTGPFAIVRHPIYLSLFGFIVATALAFGHPYNLLLATPFYWLGTHLRASIEEGLLHGAFGATYESYARDVKRFIPGVW